MARHLTRALLAAPTMLAMVVMLAACSTTTMFTGDLFEVQRAAVLAYESGEDAKAEALYQGLARAAPNDFETWLRLGNLYARSNRPDLAAEAYQHAALLNPQDSRVWYNLGIIRQRQAHAALIQAHQLIPPDDPLYRKTETMIERLAPPAAASDADPPKPAQAEQHDAAK